MNSFSIFELECLPESAAVGIFLFFLLGFFCQVGFDFGSFVFKRLCKRDKDRGDSDA